MPEGGASGRTSKVGVVVCAHRQYASLEVGLAGCLGLVEQPGDVIFVDNGSSIALGAWVSRRAPGMTIVRLEENRLFCGGYNAGIKCALQRGCDFVLLVNADTEVVNSGFVDDLLDVAARWPRAAFIGPQVYFRDQGTLQNTCFAFPNVMRQVLVWLPLRLVSSRHWNRARHERSIDFLNGVCVLCRSEALREVGLLDETYGAYLEDADWAWRAHAKGWLSVFSPTPGVIHHEEASGYEHYALKTFLLKRNTVLWYLMANKRASALLYAHAASCLAWLREFVCRVSARREKLKTFRIRLRAAYDVLLSTSATNAWPSPSVQDWDQEN